MNQLHFTPKSLLFIIALLSLLILTACSTETAPGQTAVNPPSGNTQTNTVQSSWDAATFYTATCANCHGQTGSGSSFAPALNQENIQAADTNWLIETISYGRLGTAMPAWSIQAGGQLDNNQIADMVTFLQAGSWEASGSIAQEQPFSPMASGMMRGRGMMGRGMGKSMMGNGYQP